MKNRKLVLIDFINSGEVTSSEARVGGVRFELLEHPIGWNLDLGVELIKKYDGEVDGIALSGLPKRLEVGETRILYPGYWRLLRAAHETPLYSGDELRSIFARWAVDQVLRQEPRFFAGRKVLFHCGASTDVTALVASAGARCSFADLHLLTGAPLRIFGFKRLEQVMKAVAPGVRSLGTRIDPLLGMRRECGRGAEASWASKRLEGWVRDSDIFFTFGSFLARFRSLECFRGKTVFLDYVPSDQEERLRASGAARIVVFLPDLPIMDVFRKKPFSAGAAALDQLRAVDAPSLALEEYLLQQLQRFEVQPAALGHKASVRRCAFVVHPLSSQDFFKLPALRGWSGKVPPCLVRMVEVGASRLPVFHYGTVSGIRSAATGQAAECDLYGFLATPRQLLILNEQFVYDRLVRAAELASSRGAALMGLGAYTKVVGDGGITVHRRAPIPVTTGNSFTVATSLWAAREMVEKLRLLPEERLGSRFQATAVIVGATGAIGRVSALLVGLVFQRIVLVATRLDRLLEVQSELRSKYPGIDVRVTTDASAEVGQADLIVTATSNAGGRRLFDMGRVKPGAVICDCSRPLDISREDADSRPDVLVIYGGEVELPGEVEIDADIGLSKPLVYACLAETVILTLEGRYEAFTSGRRLSIERVKEIYQLGIRHGVKLAAIRGPSGVISDEQVATVRERALRALGREPMPFGLTRAVVKRKEELKHEQTIRS